MSAPKRPVQMAVIGAAHGIKGELRVKTFTGDPEAIGGYGPLFAEDGRTFEIVSVRPQGDVVVVRFKGVGDRTAAEKLTGTALYIDRSALPDELDDDEFYHADLVGLTAQDADGAVLGKVKAVLNYGGGDILELTLASGREVLVPFTPAAVPQVALSAAFIVVDPVAAGLVDDGEEGPPGRPDRGAKSRPRGPREAGGNR